MSFLQPFLKMQTLVGYVMTNCSRTMGDRSRKLSGLDLTCERGDGLAASNRE